MSIVLGDLKVCQLPISAENCKWESSHCFTDLLFTLPLPSEAVGKLLRGSSAPFLITCVCAGLFSFPWTLEARLYLGMLRHSLWLSLLSSLSSLLSLSLSQPLLTSNLLISVTSPERPYLDGLKISFLAWAHHTKPGSPYHVSILLFSSSAFFSTCNFMCISFLFFTSLLSISRTSLKFHHKKQGWSVLFTTQSLRSK